MKNILKTLLVLIIILILPISIYYGLRLLNTNYVYEYLNRSLVVTLPNGVWFEVNGSEDLADENELIFQNDIPTVKRESINFGLKYLTYTITTENDTATRIQKVKRAEDTLSIENIISFNTDEFQTYTTRIYFSEYGEFKDDTYTQDGCSVKVTSQEGDISYDDEYAIINITYKIEDSKINDLIQLEISCL
jgi:translation elongation factor EF-1beta